MKTFQKSEFYMRHRHDKLINKPSEKIDTLSKTRLRSAMHGHHIHKHNFII